MQSAETRLKLLYDRYLFTQVILSAVMASASFLPMSFNEALESMRPGAGTRYFYPGLDTMIIFFVFAPVALAFAALLLTKSPVFRTCAALATIPLAWIVAGAVEWFGLGGAKPLIGHYLCKYSAIALAIVCLGHIPFCVELLRSGPPHNKRMQTDEP